MESESDDDEFESDDESGSKEDISYNEEYAEQLQRAIANLENISNIKYLSLTAHSLEVSMSLTFSFVLCLLAGIVGSPKEKGGE